MKDAAMFICGLPNRHTKFVNRTGKVGRSSLPNQRLAHVKFRRCVKLLSVTERIAEQFCPLVYV